MKKNKLLSLLASAAMAMTLMVPMDVSAAIAETDVAKIGDVGYATLSEAVKDATENAVIEVLKDIPNAEGMKVSSGKNFTIDFNGFSYTLIGPGAGSTNTETNGFQLLKDSTIILKDGKINIAENAVNIKRVIQNYANLTLDNMQISAINQVDGEDYVMSFNNGKTTFTGNTSVVMSNKNSIAFDLCKFSSYKSASITFDENFTGTIGGKIIYDSSDPNTHSLVINGNGNFVEIAKEVGACDNPNILIRGGSFDVDPSAYVDETSGYESAKQPDGTYKISKHNQVTIEAKAPTCTEPGNVEYSHCDFCGKYYDVVGKETTLADTVVEALGHKTTHVAAKAATCTTEGNIEYWKCNTCNKYFSDEALTKVVEDTVVEATGHKVSKIEAVAPTYTTEGNIEYYKCSECGELFADEKMTTKITLDKTVVAKLVAETPKEINPEEPVKEVTVGSKEENKTVAETEKDTVVEQIKKGETTTAVDEKTAEAIKEAVAADKDITSQVVVAKLDETQVDKEVVAKVEETFKNVGISQYLDLSILVKADDEIIGTINEVSKPLTFQIAVPEEEQAKAKYFYVVRVHEGKAEIVPNCKYENGIVTFETDKFSTYALVYSDEEPSVPIKPEKPTEKPTTPPAEEKPNDKVDTSDTNSTAIYVAAMGMAVLAAGVVVLNKKKEELMK